MNRSRNMKRVFFMSTTLVVFLLLLSGCSQKANPASPNGNKQVDPGASAIRGARGQRLPDFGQPDRQADIRGIVKSITGNEAVILKVDLRGGRGDNASSTNSGASTTPINSGTQAAPAISLNGLGADAGQAGRGFAGPGGAGGPGGGRGFGGAGSTTDRAAMLERLKAMSTGEETVTIPVGIQMLKSSVDTNTKNRTMVEATLADITGDKTVTIWLNATVTDKKVAEFVLIN